MARKVNVIEAKGFQNLISLVSQEEISWLSREQDQEAIRLKARLSQISYYASRYESNPDFFRQLAASYKLGSHMPFKAKIWYFFVLRLEKLKRGKHL